MFITSTGFAATNNCTSLLASLITRTQESTRLNAAAIHHGFNIYTGEVENISKQSKFAKDYMRLASEHALTAEALEVKIIQECLK